MKNYNFCETISQIAVKSLLFEVSASPKPGLVDRFNAGAHSDMDFFTFMSSSSVLGLYFLKCAKEGMNFSSGNYSELLTKLRIHGIEAEKTMFKETSGVNTHKGLIFSLGIICAASASCFSGKKKYNALGIENICNRVSEITRGITRELDFAYEKKILTYGEKLYFRYGVKGIRGEAESGFKTVREVSFPMIIQLLDIEKRDLNDSLVQVLMYLISGTEDTNILGRHDMETVNYSMDMAKRALELGGIFTKSGRKFIVDMDKDFINKNISPGGSADLLAVTIMFYYLGKIELNW